MKALLFIGFISMSINLFGQNNYYYWYKGEKVPLMQAEHKKFILFEKENEDQVISDFTGKSWEVIKSSEDNTVNTLFPYCGNKEPGTKKWAFVVNETGKISDSLALQFSSKILYSSPFFMTKQGEEVGLSHLFYVRLFSAHDLGKLEKLTKENNVEILGWNKYMPLWYTLACTKYSKGNALQMANLFYESDKFRASHPDLMVNAMQCVNDDYFPDQWNLNNTGQYGGTSGIDINICDAWRLTRGCNDIVVAVLDQGIETDHPDLLNIFGLSYDTESGTSPSQVLGPHGTACAGIVGAARNNNEGIAGIAPECQLMSVSNSLAATLNSRQARGDGINWAWRNGADIISNSWGSSAPVDIIDEALDSALVYGRGGLGCVIVFASGNENGTVNYPANSNPDIIAVGAMSPCGERKSPTSCDTEDEWGSNYGSQLDLVAPGVLIPTTDLQGNGEYNSTVPIHIWASGNKISTDYSNRDYTVWFNGTSAAAPHVAGVAALILSINPELTQDQVRDIIESTCTKVEATTIQQ